MTNPKVSIEASVPHQSTDEAITDTVGIPVAEHHHHPGDMGNTNTFVGTASDEPISEANVEAIAQGAVASAMASMQHPPPLTPASATTNTTTGATPATTPAGAHLGADGRPLYLIENVKGNSGQNKWMWSMGKSSQIEEVV